MSHNVYANWRRFLDDCYINWPYGEDKLEDLHDILNSLDDSIQLTAETSCKELPFLGVMIRKENIHLTTDIYYKLTDSFQCLPYTSSHPRHIKNNIPYNLARRICDCWGPGHKETAPPRSQTNPVEETISSWDNWLRCKQGPHPNNGRVKKGEKASYRK